MTDDERTELNKIKAVAHDENFRKIFHAGNGFCFVSTGTTPPPYPMARGGIFFQFASSLDHGEGRRVG